MDSIIGNQFSLYLSLLFYTSKVLRRYKKLDEMYLTYILQSKYPIFKQVSKQSLINYFKTNYSTKLSYYFLSEKQESIYNISNSMEMRATKSERWKEQLEKAAFDPNFVLKDEILFDYLIGFYSLSRADDAKILFHYIKLNQIEFTNLINHQIKDNPKAIQFDIYNLPLPNFLLTTLSSVGIHRTEDVLTLSTDAILLIFNVFCPNLIYSFSITDSNSHHTEEVSKKIESIDFTQNKWMSKYQLLIYENIPFFVSYINNSLLTEKLLFLNIKKATIQTTQSRVLYQIIRNIDDTSLKFDEELSICYNPNLFNLSSFVADIISKLPVYFMDDEIFSFTQDIHGQKLDLFFYVLELKYHKIENMYIRNNVTNCEIINDLVAACKSPFSINDCLNRIQFIGKDEVRNCLDNNSNLRRLSDNTYIRVEQAFSVHIISVICNELDYLLENLPIPIVTADKLFGRLLVQNPKLFNNLPFISSSSDFLNVLKMIQIKDVCIDKSYLSRHFIEMNEHLIYQLFLKNKESVTAEEFKEFKKVMQIRGGMTFSKLKLEFNEEFHIVDKNTIKRNVSLELDSELLEHIENCLDMFLEQADVIDSEKFRGYRLFPSINQKWNKYILKRICKTYFIMKYVIEVTENDNYLLRRINHE